MYRLLLLGFFLIGCNKNSAPSNLPAQPDIPSDEVTVLMKLTRDGDQSILKEQRGKGGVPLYDFPEGYPAAKIDFASYVPLDTTGAFVVDGQPLFWLTPELDKVVADGRVFGDLTVVNATVLSTGERKVLGKLIRQDALAPRKMAELLIVADVVLTWAHIGSELALIEERTDNGWVGVFEGTHTYYTNDENIDPVEFELSIEADGTLVVVGR
ncbi:MAG: hypothetical protein HN348_15400 [Proteobacteria bacterium]|jgi:hypothetical protein|nr:hypothetical protein [Pseudomonadota bacterium]